MRSLILSQWRDLRIGVTREARSTNSSTKPIAVDLLRTTVFYSQCLIDKHDTHLFRSITYTDHCLQYLLPEKLNPPINLRYRGHEYTHHIRTTQLKNTFQWSQCPVVKLLKSRWWNATLIYSPPFLSSPLLFPSLLPIPLEVDRPPFIGSGQAL